MNLISNFEKKNICGLMWKGRSGVSISLTLESCNQRRTMGGYMYMKGGYEVLKPKLQDIETMSWPYHFKDSHVWRVQEHHLILFENQVQVHLSYTYKNCGCNCILFTYKSFKCILFTGVAVDYSNSAGQTALFCASLEGHEGIVGILLEHGASPNEFVFT